MTQPLNRTSTMQIQDKNDQKVWGILAAISNGVPDYNLKQDITIIGRNPQCNIIINDKRLSGKHCKIQKKGHLYTIVDLSTNGTFIKNQKIGKSNEKILQHLDQIWLLPSNKVQPNETFGFRLRILEVEEQLRLIEKEKNQKQAQKLKKQEQQERQKKQEQKKKQSQKQKKINDFAQSIKEQITCSFCFEIMCIPVSVQPCNHRFCGGCLSQLVNSKKEQCIQCRKQITTAVRDSAFNSIIDDYLKSHPDEKRDPDDQEAVKKKNIFGHDPVDITVLIHGKPKKKAQNVPIVPPTRRNRGRGLRARNSDLSASDGEDDGRGRCRECATMRNGFQCSPTQIHAACFTCGKLIAQRDDPIYHQTCLLCTNVFCNLYYPPCKAGIQLRLIQDRRQQCQIDAQLLRSNKFQFEGLRNFLMGKKMTSKDVFKHIVDEYLAKDKFSYIIDRKIMKVPPVLAKEIKLQPDSAVCHACWKDLWFQMVLTYRIEVAGQMPSAIKDRPLCYYGVNCRTMDHNQDHARRYNHMAYQTKF